MKKITKSSEETIKLAEDFASGLQGGEVILLYGELGAGKTLFAKGLAKALGFMDTIISPTFGLMKVYTNKDSQAEIKTLCHADLYRIENIQEIIELGLLDYMKDPEAICLVEWPEKIKPVLPKKPIEIEFSHVSPEEREINIKDL